ncbi:MAG TPA: hypothetical protein VN867_16810 [Candidatus Binataceae bacterium]|nr:hypothetical protein [Candidatus Binataceae bacterium]
MPRKRSGSATAVSSAFRQVQQQARSLMVNLHKEIRAKEIELRRLKEEEARLISLIGQSSASPSRGRAAKTAGASRTPRVNWREVLDQLPRKFQAADVRAVRGIKGKRPSEVFAAITRWIDLGAARRRSRGMYEKV